MQTSASASRVIYQKGFTLLEVLVVVTLLALFASLVLPMLGQRTGSDSLTSLSDRLASTLQLMAETSVFRGELLAMTLTADGYTPHRFDLATSSFVELDQDQSLAVVTYPEGVTLEWQLDTESQTDISLSDTMKAVMTSDQQNEEDEPVLPQLFFFPSGEVTPVRLSLRDAETEQEISFSLDPAGRIERTDEQGLLEDDDDASTR